MRSSGISRIACGSRRRALAEAGRSDALHRVNAREGLGSYGGILATGLTSLPETWDAMMDGSQSLNHCMLGHVIE